MGFFTFIKSLTVIWPFIKEILVSNKALQEKIRRNKATTTYLLANIFIFVLFVYAFSEARGKDTSIVQLSTELSHARDLLEAEKADHSSDMVDKDSFWSPQLEQLKQQNEILQDRVNLLKKRMDESAALLEDNRETIALLRKQIQLYQERDHTSSPQQRSAYSVELERLRKQEQNIDK